MADTIVPLYETTPTELSGATTGGLYTLADGAAWISKPIDNQTVKADWAELSVLFGSSTAGVGSADAVVNVYIVGNNGLAGVFAGGAATTGPTTFVFLAGEGLGVSDGIKQWSLVGTVPLRATSITGAGVFGRKNIIIDGPLPAKYMIGVENRTGGTLVSAADTMKVALAQNQWHIT